MGNYLAPLWVNFGASVSLGSPWAPLFLLWLAMLSPMQNPPFCSKKPLKWRPRTFLSRVAFFEDGPFRSMKSIFSAFAFKSVRKQFLWNHHFYTNKLLNCFGERFARQRLFLSDLLFHTRKLTFSCFLLFPSSAAHLANRFIRTMILTFWSIQANSWRSLCRWKTNIPVVKPWFSASSLFRAIAAHIAKYLCRTSKQMKIGIEAVREAVFWSSSGSCCEPRPAKIIAKITLEDYVARRYTTQPHFGEELRLFFIITRRKTF